jgi:ATP synthase E chain
MFFWLGMGPKVIEVTLTYCGYYVQLIRVSAFGLGATYGGARLAYLKQKKREEEEEHHKKELQEAVAKALAARDQQEEQARSMSLLFPLDDILF